MATFCLISVYFFSQTYKLETVFSDKISETYLSHWNVLEESGPGKPELFSLWGYQRYYDNWANGAYEVEYFKGTAKETYQFLSQVVEFSRNYRDLDKVVTTISGVKVKTLRTLGYRFTLAFEKENKVACQFTLNQWNDFLTRFVVYCETREINYN